MSTLGISSGPWPPQVVAGTRISMISMTSIFLYAAPIRSGFDFKSNYYSFIAYILDTSRTQLPFLRPNPATGQRRHNIPPGIKVNATFRRQLQTLTQHIKSKRQG
jgi:hypothetical protein